MRIQDNNDNVYQLNIIDYSQFLYQYESVFTHFFRERINFEINQFNIKTPDYVCYELVDDQKKVIGLFATYETMYGVSTMYFSVIHPEYRRLGLYKAFLKFYIDASKANGLNRITSTHSNSNNPIIIAKMQYDFYITNLQVCPFFGSQIELTYFIDKDMENIFKFRCGDISLDQSIAKRFSQPVSAYRKYFDRLNTEIT